MDTRSTEAEAPAEAATDAPTGDPRQPHPTLPDDFGDLDRRAIDTARVLAMDAVQNVGNGHPGTAMSMAPTAYLLFSKWLRHDPRQPDVGDDAGTQPRGEVGSGGGGALGERRHRVPSCAVARGQQGTTGSLRTGGGGTRSL